MFVFHPARFIKILLVKKREKSRFEGASGIAAKAIKLIDLIALTCRTISLDYLVVDPIIQYNFEN